MKKVVITHLRVDYDDDGVELIKGYDRHEAVVSGWLPEGLWIEDPDGLREFYPWDKIFSLEEHP